jgi:4-hydroxybenzoate polyprenyltransferase
MNLLINLLRTARPRQWIKNFALFAGLLFTAQLDNPEYFQVVAAAFVVFSGLTSAVYFLNDVFDIERDRQHPFKSFRPIASGKISVKLAVAFALGLIMILLPIAYQLAPSFFYACVLYLLLQLIYSAYLKSIILLDVIMIAAGFILRIYAGIWLVDAHLSVWFLLSVISFSLFLAIGKRRSERTLMHAQAARHRETLLHYPASLLDSLTSMFANSAWLTYALFAFQLPSVLVAPEINNFLSNFSFTLSEAKYMMATVPLVIYGVMRYLYIIYEKKEAESPERVLLSDIPLLSTVLIWLLMVIYINYYLGSLI